MICLTHYTTLAPLALQCEGSPEEWRRKPLLFEQRNLRGLQRLRWSQPLFQHSFIEPRHQLCCANVTDAPQTDHHTWRACVHKAARQADKTFALYFLAKSGLASR